MQGSDVNESVARAHVYGLLASVFRRPGEDGARAPHRDHGPMLGPALARLGAPPELVARANQLVGALAASSAEELEEAYERSFEPSGGQERPPNETAHAPETPQESLTRTFQLADIAGFYRAFGVELAPDGERADHIAAELEFMHLLAVKQALAEFKEEPEHAAICHDAAASFLRDHLGRWCPAFGSELEQTATADVYRSAGALLAHFIELELSAV